MNFVFSYIRMCKEKQWVFVFHQTLANMSLNVNIVLLILSYQCYTTCASKLSSSIKQQNESSKSFFIIIYNFVNNMFIVVS